MNIKELKRRAGINEVITDKQKQDAQDYLSSKGSILSSPKVKIGNKVFGADKTVLGNLAQDLNRIHDFILKTGTIRDQEMETLLKSIRILAYLDHLVKDDGTLKFNVKTSESIQEACCRACEQDPPVMNSNDISDYVKNMETGVCSIMAGYDTLDRDEVEEILTSVLHYAWEILDNHLNNYETQEIKRLAGLIRETSDGRKNYR